MSSPPPVSKRPSPGLISRLLRSRLLALFFVFALAIVTIGAGDTGSRFNSIGHKMVCTCSCGQILLECNHVGCPNSSGMIDELKAQLGGGGSDTSIFNAFVAKYGPTVLAAPIRGGFDNVAWIVPIAVFFFAIVGTAFLIREWRSRQLLPIGTMPGNAHHVYRSPGNDMRERIRRETDF